MSKDLVARWFSKISPNEKNIPLLILNGMAYTPQETYNEVMRGSPVGNSLQSLIEQGRFGTTSEDETELIKTRLRMSWQSKPDQNKVLFVALSSSGIGPKEYTPAKLLQELASGGVGVQQFINNEASYMRMLLQVR